jgi:hypothetical protein
VNKLLALEPPEEEEMFFLEWDLYILNLPLYQRDNSKIDSARVFSGRYKDLGFRAGYARPPINHDFRAKGLHLIGMLFPLPYATGCVFSCQTNISVDVMNAKPTCQRRRCGAPPRGRRRYYSGAVQLHFPYYQGIPTSLA